MINVRKVNWESYKDALQNIRSLVFIDEQRVPRNEEYDGVDDFQSTHHFAAIDEDKNLIACARLVEGGKIGRMAVLQEHRNKKIGNELLREVILFALKNNIVNKQGKLFLHAQIRARSFYERAGFVGIGDIYLEAGIEHITMEFKPTSASAITTLFDDRVLRFENTEDIHLHLALVTRCTSRYLNILSDHLDAPIFADEDFVLALSKAARRSRNSQIRILLRDSKKLHGINHPLVTLSQRLSSKVEIRALTEEPQKPDIAYLISDAQRLVYFNNESERVGFANYRAGPEAQNLLEEFDNLWNRHSRRDPNLERLSL